MFNVMGLFTSKNNTAKPRVMSSDAPTNTTGTATSGKRGRPLTSLATAAQEALFKALTSEPSTKAKILERVDDEAQKQYLDVNWHSVVARFLRGGKVRRGPGASRGRSVSYLLVS